MPTHLSSVTAGEPVGHYNSLDSRIDALVEGVSQLVEGQRRFAEEFGLTYERVFHDGFEAFKGREVRDVLHEWVQGDGGDAAALERLFQDLADHQFALLTAVEQVMSGYEARQGLLAALRRQPAGPATGAALPQLVTAYARTREAVANNQSDQRSAT